MKNERLHLINVSLPLISGEANLYEVEIQNGRFVSIKAQFQMIENQEFPRIGQMNSATLIANTQKWDVEGRIMLPEFIDSHMHLDKAFCLPQVPNHSGTLSEAIVNYHAASPSFTLEGMKARMLRAALQALTFGTTTIRTHIDLLTNRTDDSVFLGIQAALEVKELLQPYMKLQIIPMSPLGLNAKEIDMVEETIRMGVDAIGGAPHLSLTSDQDIDIIFGLAAKYNLDIDLHTDESDDATVNTLATIIARTQKYDYQGRVVVDHLCSLSAMDDEKATRLIEQIVDTQIGVITLPAANFYLQGRDDRGIVRRGLTRVKEILSAGAMLATASDNIHDPYHPYGRGDLLQIGLITAYGAHLGSSAEQENLLRMITVNPARLLGLDNFGIEPGGEAAFVLLDVYRLEEILTLLSEVRWVYKNGSWLSVVNKHNIWGHQSLENLWKKVMPSGAGVQ